MGHYQRSLVLILGLALVSGVPGARAEFDIDKVERSVVRIYVEKTKDGRTYRITGSGFVINADGYVVTNNHVVENSIWVKIPDGSWSNLRSAEIVWRSKFVDLAVIRVRDFKRPHVALAVPEPKRGARIWAVGFPGPGDSMERRAGGKLSLQATVTAGVVGKLFLGSHDNDPRSARRMIQHSAETNPGNSGGPLFNACHQVVGIHTYGTRPLLIALAIAGMQRLSAVRTRQLADGLPFHERRHGIPRLHAPVQDAVQPPGDRHLHTKLARQP